MRAALVLLVLAACATAPGPPAKAVDDGWVVIYVRFEPALTEPGLLVAEHEAGVRLELPTGRDGVELRLPPGPASLRLVVGGEVFEQPIEVRAPGELEFKMVRIAVKPKKQS